MLAAGVVFCAVASLLGRETLLTGAVANAAVPYLAVPFAVGFTAARETWVRAGLWGALTTLVLLIAFYGVSLIDPKGFGVDFHAIFVEYGPLGMGTGFLVAALARRLAPRVARAPWRWAALCCLAVALAHGASWAMTGWGVEVMDTSSGPLAFGASGLDVLISSAIVLALSWGVIVFAIRGLTQDSAHPPAPESFARHQAV